MRTRYKVLVTILILFVTVGIGAYAWLQHPKFGALPTGGALARIQQSPHYHHGEFRNLTPDPPSHGGGFSLASAISFLFGRGDLYNLPAPLPSIKTELHNLDREQDVVLWLGHSSFFVQLESKRLLIDPVFSSSAAPLGFMNKAFPVTTPYTAADMPAIDYLLISHDHWDHLDYPTIMALQNNIDTIVCGLGTGAHFERWGFAPEQIIELDWFDTVTLAPELEFHALPARHYSGRLFSRNQSLWLSFALISTERKIFFSGDSGYGPHFSDIGERFNGFDLVMLDSGQYNEAWRHIHMMPEDAVLAAQDLQARWFVPAHVGKFALAYHTWDEPFQVLAAHSTDKPFQLLTPRMGEVIELDTTEALFAPWWEGVR